MKIILSLLSVFISFSFASTTDLQLMHTNPVCAHAGKTPAWCTLDDLIPVSTANGMIDKINAQIDLAVDPLKAKIYVAYFSFSNKLVFRKLCSKAKAGIPIEFFLDNSYRGNALNQDLIHGVCTKEDKITYDQDVANGKPWPPLANVKFHYLGKTDVSDPNNITWRLHHNKFLIIDSGDGDNVKINFSSGNLSSFGTSLHFDHWVTVTLPRISNMFNTHMCVVSSMKAALDPDNDGIDNDLDDPIAYRSSLNTCFKNVGILRAEDAIAQEKIAPFFSPNPQNGIAKSLIGEIAKIKSGDSITGAIQHFTHTDIAKALIQACQRGVVVKMLMDDDIFTGESEVPGVDAFYNSTLDGTCLQIRFMQTNGEINQMMHNKFLVLGQQRVFAGAGHFTYSAMTTNYENFYLMEDLALQSQYADLFNVMWAASISKEEIKPAPPEPIPAQ